MTGLFAVDTDGTCEVGLPPGPVKVEALHRLVRLGHLVFAVGNVQLQALGFPGPKDHNGNPLAGLFYGKSTLLREWRAARPGMDSYIVVDDDPSQYMDGWAGWELWSPSRFAQEFNP